MTAAGTFPMAYFSLYVDFWGIATPGILAGIGSGLFFVPLTAVAFASIPNAKYDEASGVYALMRGMGGSAGIAVVSWLLVRHWPARLGPSISPPRVVPTQRRAYTSSSKRLLQQR